MILLFAGSNSPHSINQTLVEWIARLLEDRSPTVIRLTDYALPIYSPTEEKKGFPSGLQLLFDQLSRADTIVIAVAEHNGSLPAFFKNTLDWLSRLQKEYRVFQGKKLHLLSASPGQGGAGAIRHSSEILQRLGAPIVQSLTVPQFYQRISKRDDQSFPDASTEQLLNNFIQKI
jgi:NAD(P)H-dependent FMN reductase